ncbi:MAG: DUF2496 domain-containing protein [Ferrimonas sp.]
MSSPLSSPAKTLAEAPAEMQLAVDLIYLFEANEIDPKLALAALAIVKKDLHRQLANAADKST